MHTAARTVGRRLVQMFRRFAATVVLSARPPRHRTRRGRQLRVRRRNTRRAGDRPRRAERELVRLEHRPPARDDPRRRRRHVPLAARAHLARPRSAGLRPLLLGDGDGRVRAPGGLQRSRPAPPFDSAAAAGSERLVLRDRRPRSRLLRLRAFLLDGRVGLLAVEGELLPPRVAVGRVGRDAGARVPPAALPRSWARHAT